MGKIFREIIISVKQAYKTLVLFELFFKIITGLCFIPGLVAFVNFSLKATGYTFITSRNINEILKNPYLIVLFVLIILFFAFITLIEISSLTIFFGHDFKENGFYLRELLFLSFKELLRIINPHNIMLILYVICITPVINFISIIRYIFRNEEVPIYIYHNVIKSKSLAIFLIAVFLILFILCIQMLFVFCYFFLEHKNLNQSFELSKKLMRGRALKTIVSVLLCNIFYLFIYFLFYLIIIFFIRIGVQFFYEQRVAYAIFLTIFNIINKVFVFILSSFEIVTNFSLTVHLYLDYSGKSKKRYPILFSKKKVRKRLPFNFKKAISILLTIITLLTGVGIYLLVNNDYTLMDDEKTKITSHRGNSIAAPENTMASIDYAINEMADYAEIDARETKDGVIVVFHDDNLKRIANINKFIWNLKYEQIQNLDVGSWFSDQFAGERIPTLDEVLKYSKGKIKLNIEIKTSNHDKHLEESIVQLIEENDFVKDCVITSFDYKALKKVKKLNSHIKTGYIISAVYGNFYDLNVDFFSLNRNFVSERTVIELHKRGKELHVWTVNDKEHIDQLARLGVDNIITDNPVMARTVIYSTDFPSYTLNFLKLVFNY